MLPSPAVADAPTPAASVTQPPTSATPEPQNSATPRPPIATSLPSPTPGPPRAPDTLPLGAIVEYDGWSATLLRPDYGTTLEGSIGAATPTGRFVLVLIAVSNQVDPPRRMPPDLFTLSDSDEQRYLPVPEASSAYLATYGRGQRGDLALEDQLDRRDGVLTVPLIFDVPDSAADLRLHIGPFDQSGWPIGADTTPSNVGP